MNTIRSLRRPLCLPLPGGTANAPAISTTVPVPASSIGIEVGATAAPTAVQTPPAPNTIGVTLSAIGRRHELICSALVVVLSGYLEEFMRDSAEEFMDALHARGRQFSTLPVDIQTCHFLNGARVLQDCGQRSRRDFKLYDASQFR